MNVSTEKIIADIIKQGMSLGVNQIWVYNQNFVAPKTEGLLVSVAFVDNKIVSKKTEMSENSTGGLIEVQSLNVLENIKINIASKNAEAKDRKNEILLSLDSFYSQRQQEKLSFKIAQHPSSLRDISSEDGSALISEFVTIVPVLVWYEKEITIAENDYYDNFEVEAIIDKDGEFTFNIGDT